MLSRAELKYLRSLRTKAGRKKAQQFLAEGVRLLEEAARNKFWPEKVYYTEVAFDSRIKSLIGIFQKHKIFCQAIRAKELNTICDTNSPQGVAALFGNPPPRSERVLAGGQYRVLLLDNLADPGNAGTLIRSAAAFGFQLVLLTPNSVERFNPKTIRSTAGSIFAIPVEKVTFDLVREYKLRYDWFVVGGDASGRDWSKVGSRLKKHRRLVLAVGSEADGLTSQIMEQVDLIIRISHSSRVESLNAAVAGSIFMKSLCDLKMRGQ